MSVPNDQCVEIVRHSGMIAETYEHMHWGFCVVQYGVPAVALGSLEWISDADIEARKPGASSHARRRSSDARS
ncbi:hypothetical protein ACFU96_03400 [Streptomyces sp. NPDC057620]|uniref:Uncharacterized protein n=1 Tax=Streptomyces liliiviolaceus TaxID=2823109 RepID=A0A940XVL1_9ACTN|nr:hypothetical protein [Streptomyces liliiviolaceus]MBQ0850715.1 hypothetical protein [Streptomyces liliiviolaceus]